MDQLNATEEIMKSLLAVPFLFLASIMVLAQDHGIIDCQDETSVMVLDKPAGMVVIKVLPCGQPVTVIGLERGYAKIQLSENVCGYVDAKYIRSSGSQCVTNNRVAELEAEVGALQRQSMPVQSQIEVSETDRRVAELEAEVEALKRQTIPIQSRATMRAERRSNRPALPNDYETDSPTHFDIGGMFTWIRSFESGFDNDFFGWNATFGGNITKYFGLELNVSGNYWDAPVGYVGASYHGFAGGPRITFPASAVTPFVHFLVGFAHGSGSAFGFGVSANYLTLMPGFGLDVNVTRHFGIRAFQADYPVLRGVGAWSYENLRIGAGFVTRF
jgi:hypothetical protein